MKNRAADIPLTVPVFRSLTDMGSGFRHLCDRLDMAVVTGHSKDRKLLPCTMGERMYLPMHRRCLTR